MKFSIIFALVMVFFVPPAAAQQTWQSTLQSKFDIVETFDQLKDWNATLYGNEYNVIGNPNIFPKKLDGSASIWQMYSNWGSSATTSAIADHGSSNNWGGTGKSLILDYTTNLGPGRLGFKIGTSPTDGYQSDVYVFFMNKYPKGFFPQNGNQFLFFGYLKTFEVATGFRDIGNWGTVAQQSLASNTPQTRNVYGLNSIVMNYNADATYRVPLCVKYNIATAVSKSGGDEYQLEYTQEIWWTSADLSGPANNGDWFGVEYHFKRSNPPGNANGAVEAWIYDKNGNVIGQGSRTNIVTFRNSSVSLADHAYNKFVWGGNRFEQDFSGRTDGHASDPSQGHAYVDDIIVNASRIGPTYFQLLKGGDPPPAAPANLRIR